MRQHKNTQIGSLMIEMVAVIGLIALITPILFHQIHKRNEEIVNTQIATEMRAVKDAMASYIQANEQTLAKKVQIFKDGKYIATANEECEDLKNISIGNISTYFQGNANILTEYDLMLCYYTVPVNETEGTYRPVIYGVAVQLEGMGSLRRASKIASLIGLEGGVATSTAGLMGMQGVWELPISGLDPTAVGVISSFDDASNASILKDVRWQHMQSDTVQAPIIVAERLGIKDVLTVDTTNCIQNYGSGTVSIKATDDTTPCAPFFEVNPTTKEVRLAGTIRTGTAVSGATCSSTTKTDCEKEAHCVWVEASASEEKGKCVAEYLLNPAGTSVMEDIKLSSRGGAKLSDLLPRWNLIEVETVESGEKDLTPWSCPTGYLYGIMVIPVKFSSAVTDNEIRLSSGKNQQTSITIPPNITSAIVQKYCVWKDQNEATN